MLLTVGRFVLLALTDAAMLPALNVMKRNRRHFELFVGILQLVTSFFFNAAEAFNTQLFLTEIKWHFISDVVSLAYFLLLCVHLMGYKDENHNIILRYVAFSCAWIFKTKDGWNYIACEEMLVVCYLFGVLYRRGCTRANDISPFNKQYGVNAMLCLVGAACMWFTSIYFDQDEDHMAWGVAEGLMHMLAGAAFYYAWLTVPCLDSKKDDLIPMQSSYV
ncbi:unnamed protein product [Peronospora belbahrii]|uniref:Post-GPI attachment to proteins factor 3 n=1 Tax=Peronospora belbahrii TaxID=622444 RepID=A0AAU9KI00_9STRA|nr:unnamed protein product [Peronospora belbahrii]CAH0520627.1 unnamed protein product [Peronospora belbahrii]